MSVPSPIEAGQARTPLWVLAVGAAVALLALVTLAFNLEGTNPDLVGPAPSGPGPSQGPDAVALIETAGCQACHGADLSGDIGPDLHGMADGPKSENLQPLGADFPETWANLWIDGSGPEVEGLERGGMPVFGGPGGDLSAEEIAIIVDYLLTLE